MTNCADLQRLLTAQLETLVQMYNLGEEILACNAPDQLDNVLDLITARAATFERLAELPFPDGTPFPSLIEHQDPGLRVLACQVHNRVKAVIDQDEKIQEKLVLLRGKVGAQLQMTQLALQVNRTYRPPVPPRDGAFIDKRR